MGRKESNQTNKQTKQWTKNCLKYVQLTLKVLLSIVVLNQIELFGPNQAREYVGPDLGSNYLTDGIPERIFEKWNLKKISRQQNNFCKQF